MGERMPAAGFTDEQFLALWREHGADWSWGDYAEALSALTGGQITAVAVRVRVNRARARWREQHGVDVGLRRTDASAMFAQWPDIDKRFRDTYLYRVLEWEAVALDRGPDALSEQARHQWEAARIRMLQWDEVIRYDPERGLWRDRRAAGDPSEGPVESRKSYLSRHPEAGAEDTGG